MQRLEDFFFLHTTNVVRRKVFVAHGLGGIGKTQLCIEFARRNQDKFNSVFWLDGSSGSALEQSFVDVARRLPSEEVSLDIVNAAGQAESNTKDTVRSVRGWLSLPSNKKWLLIIDNMDLDYRAKEKDQDAYDYREYLPDADHGNVLLTSRLLGLQPPHHSLHLGRVRHGQARAILGKNAGNERLASGSPKDVENLLDRLDGLPLALTQAGSFLYETGTPVKDYLEDYDMKWKELMEIEDELQIEKAQRSVLTTWKISYERVQKQNPQAAEFLKLWAFLDCGDVWYELIAMIKNIGLDGQPSAKEELAWLLAISQSSTKFRVTLRALLKYSLAESREGTESYAMHSVLHKWCYLTCMQEDKVKTDLLCRIALHLVARMVHSSADRRSWKLQKRLLPHAVQVYNFYVERFDMRPRDPPIALAHIGDLFRDQHKLHEAEELYRRALTCSEETVGSEHLSTFQIVNNIGVIYLERGKLDEAEIMFQRALSGLEKTDGPEQISKLHTFNSFGNLYKAQNKFSEAEVMYQRALAGFEKAYGLDHVSTLDTVNNIGKLYKIQGELIDKEKAIERALTSPSGLDEFLSINNSQTKLSEAEKMIQRALIGFEKAYGLDHIDTLQTVNDLGDLYNVQSQPNDAERMYSRVITGFEEIHGPGHTLTLNAAFALGDYYEKHSKLEEAERMYRRALIGFQNSSEGLESTSTFMTVRRLDDVYKRQGKLVEAEEMYQRALAGLEKAHGSDCDCVLGIIGALGFLYESQDRLVDAEAMHRRPLASYEKTRGHEDSSTLAIVAIFAAFYWRHNKLDQAEMMYHRAVIGFEKVLQPDHAWILETAHTLGHVYASQWKLDEAEKMYQKSLEGFKKTYGPHHPSTLGKAINIGTLYYNLAFKSHVLRDRSNSRGGSDSSEFRRIIDCLLASGKLMKLFPSSQPALLSGIGRMLLWAGGDKDALVIFKQQLHYRNGTVHHGNTVCDGCDNDLTLETGRFICRACFDVDLCTLCHSTYELEGGLSHGLPEHCRGHTFVS